jgi:hypothetical protein
LCGETMTRFNMRHKIPTKLRTDVMQSLLFSSRARLNALWFAKVPCCFPCWRGICRPRPVRSGLPPPPRSPAPRRISGAVGMVANSPGLWREGRGRRESVWGGTRSRGQKSSPGLRPRQTFPGRNWLCRRRRVRLSTEMGSTMTAGRPRGSALGRKPSRQSVLNQIRAN